MSDSEKIDQIHEVLLGNAIKGKLGLIHHHDQMYEDLYGVRPDGTEPRSKKNTILARISKIEDKQNKASWIAVGIITCYASIKIGLAALAEKFVGK